MGAVRDHPGVAVRFSGRKTIVSALLLSSLLFGSVAAASPASAAGTFRATHSEKQMVRLINQARARHHRAALHYSPGLARLARQHSALMASKATIFHTSNLAYTLRNFHWSIAGENVGMGPTIDALHLAFMASTPHRHNNLDKRFHRFGVGVVWRNGIAFITVEFMS
ncbi:MAG: CAP domain-containing protein [Actinomycetota bacterium]